MHSLTTKPLNIAIVASSFYTCRSTENYELNLVQNAIYALDDFTPETFESKLMPIFQSKKHEKQFLPNECTKDLWAEWQRNNLQIIIVPGALELSQACQWLIDQGNIDGILAVGCVVRGKTTHYDHVCQTAFAQLSALAMQTKTPLATAIVTAENDTDAQERVYSDGKNLGFHGMKALLDIIKLKNTIYENCN